MGSLLLRRSRDARIALNYFARVSIVIILLSFSGVHVTLAPSIDNLDSMDDPAVEKLLPPEYPDHFILHPDLDHLLPPEPPDPRLFEPNFEGDRSIPEGISPDNSDIGASVIAQNSVITTSSTIYVPGDYPSIQQAIDNVAPGDTIIVRDGVYYENVVVDKPYLTIKSENGSENCIVDGLRNSDVFTIVATGITLEGFNIVNSSAYPGAGINVTSDYSIIKSNNISSNCDGIHVFSDNNIISHNTFVNNSAYGIILDYSNNNTLIDNTVTNNWFGIELHYSGNNTLMYNAFSSNQWNFGVSGYNESHFKNEIDTTNLLEGKPIYYLVNFYDTTIDSSSNAGTVYCINCINITVKNLTFTNTTHGILFFNTTDSKIQGNKIGEKSRSLSNDFGIYFLDSNNNTIINNTVYNNYDYGILIVNSSNNSIMDNNINTNYWAGVYVYDSDKNNITGNTITNNGIAFGLFLSNSNIIDSNNISNNKMGYFILYASNGSKIVNNTFYSNYNGIRLFYSSNNKIYLNSFINNSDGNVKSYNSSNLWNSTEKITYTYNRKTYTNYLGNYWDDYTDLDTDGDGIGDTPYSVDGGADYYPLMQPFENYNITSKVVEIPIGVLVDLSGPLSTYGQDISDLLKIAQNDVNGYFEENNKPYKVKLYVEDTKIDPKITLDKVQALYGEGIKLFIGPMGSGEVKNIASYVNDNKLIIVSPSSTANPSLLGMTEPSDKKYIFRFIPEDSIQTKAIASEAASLGIKAVVIMYIGNSWGRGLAVYGVQEFEGAGIEVKDVIEYPDPPPTDFTSYIQTVENDVNELLQTYSSKEVALVTFSYEEAYTILSQVADNSVLMDVIWLGCDGTVKSRQISKMCDDVNKVRMYSTLFESKGDSYGRVNETYFREFGRIPYQYALNAYDSAWVLAMSFEQVYDSKGEYDPDEMANIIPLVTRNFSEGKFPFTPVSGYIVLNEWNDRISGTYAVWYVENCQWMFERLWSVHTNELEIRPTEVDANIGSTVEFTVILKNSFESNLALNLSLRGINNTWYSLPNNITLTAHEQREIPLRINIPDDCSITGDYSFIVLASYNNTTLTASAVLHVLSQPVVSHLYPPNSAKLSSNDVIFSWKTQSPSTTELYIKKEGESYVQYTGETTTNHNISLTLERNTNYTWYAKSCSACGCTQSEERTLYIDNGIVFTQDIYQFTIERDYNQHAYISVQNKDDEPHDLLVSVTNPYTDIAIGFVGNGSDRIVSLDPDELVNLELIIHAQDASHSIYEFPINLTNLGEENITDYAVVRINVRQPVIDFDITEVSTDPLTLAKKLRITNNGDPLNDFSITLDDSLKGKVVTQPILTHFSLGTGDYVEFYVVPLWSESSIIQGRINVTAAGITKSLFLDFSCSAGNIYHITLENPILYFDLDSGFCINRKHVVDKFYLPAGFDADDVKYAYVGVELRASYGQTNPYDVWIAINSHQVGSLEDTFPRGYFRFDIDSSYLNYAFAGTAENVFTLDTNMNSGYYTPLSDVRVVLCLDELKMHVCAASEEEALNAAWNTPYIHKPSESITVNILAPEDGDRFTTNEPILIKAEVIGDSGGEKLCNVTATFNTTDEVVYLVDNGLHNDGSADDGVYANEWIPDVNEPTEITVSACNCAASTSDKVVVTPNGTLIVNVYNVNENPASEVAGTTKVELIKSGETSTYKEKTIDENSKATFTVPAGEYYINVWHDPEFEHGEVEYWGQMTGITVNAGETTEIDFYRYNPYIEEFDAELVLNENSDVSVKVRVPSDYPEDQASVKTHVIIKDESGDIVLDEESSTYTVQKGETTEFTFSFNSSEQTYTALAKAYVVGGGEVCTDNYGWIEFSIQKTCKKLDVAFVDVELLQDNQVVEENTTDLNGEACFSHSGNKIRLLGEEFDFSDQNIFSKLEDKELCCFKIKFNITSDIKLKVSKDIRTQEGANNVIHLPLEDEFYTFEVLSENKFAPIKFKINPLISRNIITKGMFGHSINVEDPVLKGNLNIDDKAFTDFEPFLDTPKVKNFGTEISEQGQCAGMMITSLLFYGYKNAYQYDGKQYKVYLDLNHLREHTPNYILGCECIDYVIYKDCKCGYVEDGIKRIPGYDITPLDNLYLSIVIHQQYGGSSNPVFNKMLKEININDVINEIDNNRPVIIVIDQCHALLAFGYIKSGNNYHFAIYDPNYPAYYAWLKYDAISQKASYEKNPCGDKRKENIDVKFFKIHTINYEDISDRWWDGDPDRITELKDWFFFELMKNYKIYTSDLELYATGSGFYGYFDQERFYESNIAYSAGFMELSKDANNNINPLYVIAYPSKFSGVSIKTDHVSSLDPLTVIIFKENETEGMNIKSPTNLTVTDNGLNYTINGKGWINIEKYIISDEGVYNTSLNITGTNITVHVIKQTFKADTDGDGSIDENLSAPTADFFTVPESPVVGENVTFNASSSYDLDGNITNYFWDLGDGNTSTQKTLIHSYSSTGNYTVVLTVTDNDGLNSSLTKVLTVRPKGDVDGDSELNLTDAIYLAKHVVKLPGYEEIYADGDIDCDGEIDIIDAVYLAKHVVGLPGYEELYPCSQSRTNTTNTNTTIKIGSGEVNVNEKTEVSISAYNATDLANFDINITYDPSIANITNVTVNPSFGTAIVNLAHASEGWVRIATFNTGSGLNGSVLLSTLEVKGVSEGKSSITQEINTLANSSEVDIQTEVGNGVLTVKKPSGGGGRTGRAGGGGGGGGLLLPTPTPTATATPTPTQTKRITIPSIPPSKETPTPTATVTATEKPTTTPEKTETPELPALTVFSKQTVTITIAAVIVAVIVILAYVVKRK